IPLPPGKYTLFAYTDAAYPTRQPITVMPGEGQQPVDPIVLRPTEWVKLVGKPAPEIPEVVAWKNCGPIRLPDVRGKVVLLDFWGYWCGPCVGGMPQLFDLYDKHHDQGLEIIAIHEDRTKTMSSTPLPSLIRGSPRSAGRCGTGATCRFRWLW
ncbi:MAG TPA: TlpA disulfide reductase family protein, partial [Pirellulales bacterium]